MKITVGIPAYKAKGHIENCLSSIQIQTIRDEVEVIIASDFPEDNYEYLKNLFPDLNITILECEENTGPGLARQRALDACKTDWITFIDADDLFYTPFALETLGGAITPDSVVVQGVFLQEVDPNPQKIRTVPIDNKNHPWVFGRLYNKKFLDANEIGFSELRAMED
jgi:glycosyltransferase involved in cell wall biosynthesis